MYWRKDCKNHCNVTFHRRAISESKWLMLFRLLWIVSKMQSSKISQGERELDLSKAFPPQIDTLLYWSQLEPENSFEEMAKMGREVGRHLKLLFDLFNSFRKDVTVGFSSSLAEFSVLLNTYWRSKCLWYMSDVALPKLH